jgi:hypothetical protein
MISSDVSFPADCQALTPAWLFAVLMMLSARRAVRVLADCRRLPCFALQLVLMLAVWLK